MARGTDCAAIVNVVRTAAIPAEVVAAFKNALNHSRWQTDCSRARWPATQRAASSARECPPHC